MENSENPDSPKEYIRKITEEPPSEDPNAATSNALVSQNEKRKNDFSDENSSSPKKSRCIDKEEDYFSKLCEMAFDISNKVLNLKDSDINRGISTIIDSFRYSEGNKFSNIDFTKPENLWPYLLRYGPSSAGLIRNRFSKVLDAREDIRNYMFTSKQTIKVLNLGSGPGCDIVGLCSSLSNYVSNKSIQFTQVDSFKGWVSVFNIVEFLLREGNYGKACEFFKNNDISTNYLSFDLTKDPSENEAFENSLKEADIIMLNRVISIIEKDSDRTHIAESIERKMNKRALLFVVDTPYFGRQYFNNLKLLPLDTNETLAPPSYTFQGPNAFNINVAKDSNSQIYVFCKKRK